AVGGAAGDAPRAPRIGLAERRGGVAPALLGERFARGGLEHRPLLTLVDVVVSTTQDDGLGTAGCVCVVGAVAGIHVPRVGLRGALDAERRELERALGGRRVANDLLDVPAELRARRRHREAAGCI